MKWWIIPVASVIALIIVGFVLFGRQEPTVAVRESPVEVIDGAEEAPPEEEIPETTPEIVLGIPEAELIDLDTSATVFSAIDNALNVLG